MILLLDAYHLGDPLFITGLARDLAARETGAILVHGSAERGERALESLGLAVEQREGVWSTTTDEETALVERAARDLNRDIAHELNEAGVASIRVIGADRGLLKRSSIGSVTANRPMWLAGLVGQGVVAVIASLVEHGDGPLREADPAAAAATLAVAFGEPVSVLVRAQRSDRTEVVSLSADPEQFGDPDAVRRLLDRGCALRAVERSALRSEGQTAGKSVVA